MKAPKHWYRVGLSGNRVVSCAVVERAKQDSVRVRYVQAASESEAQRLALRSLQAEAMRQIRHAWAREGKCTRCGGKRDTDAKSCAACAKLIQKANDRRAARLNGEEVPVPAHGFGSRGFRLSVLQEVQRAWVKANNNAQFSKWLAGELLASSGGKAA